MFNARTINNIVTKEEAKAIIEFGESIEPWQSGGTDGYWANRCLNGITIYEEYNKEIGKLMYDIRARAWKAIQEAYGLEKVYPDLFQIVRWYPGTDQTPHCDDMTNIELNEEIAEAFGHREFGSVIYLNDNYTGGHTFYPDHNIEIVPRVGTLAVHPADPTHMHGVTKVEGGMRYTLASFWTQREDKFDGWVI